MRCAEVSSCSVASPASGSLGPNPIACTSDAMQQRANRAPVPPSRVDVHFKCTHSSLSGHSACSKEALEPLVPLHCKLKPKGRPCRRPPNPPLHSAAARSDTIWATLLQRFVHPNAENNYKRRSFVETESLQLR